MSTQNRAAVLAKIHKVLKKHYKPLAAPPERSVLEHLLYACCLENARPEDADEAYARIQQSFFDWNEVRVTTVAELADHLANLPEPIAAAGNLKRALQGVFEAHFAFDIEFLRKQNLGKSEKDLEKYTGLNPFLIAYVVQNALGGHAIPCCRGALDALLAVGAATAAEVDKKHVPGLERAIPKNKGHEFGSLLHQLGADVVISPTSQRVRQTLLEIDPDAKDRLPKRKKEETPAPAVPRAKTEADSKKSPPAAPTNPGALTHRKPAPPTPPAKSISRESKPEVPPKRVEKTEAARPAAPDAKRPRVGDDKKAAAKRLAKKKPR